jgi:hypothetical protein
MNSQRRFTTLRRLTLLVLGALGVLSIIASGGGGGDGGTPGTPATITTTNAADLMADALFGTSDPTGSITAAKVQQSASVGQSASLLRTLTQRLEATYWATISEKQATSQRATPALSIDETDDCDNLGVGTVHITGNLNPDGTGTLTFTFTNCLTSGLTYNGQFTLSVPDPSFNEITITMRSLNVTNFSNIDQTFNGTIHDVLPSSTTETQTYNLKITDNLTGVTVSAQNLVLSFVFSGSSCTLSFSGRVTDSRYGFVDISQVIPFAFANCSQTFPDGGVVVLTGANNAKIRVEALSSTLFTIELDLDGDNTYELKAYLNWTDLGTPIDEDLGDDDMDQMHNSWETNYMLDPTDPADAGVDTDSDGLTNLQEYQAGRNPNIPGS